MKFLKRLFKKIADRIGITEEDKSEMMRKMVTSYSIFLVIILVLGVFLFHFSFKNTRDEYYNQMQTNMLRNADFFEQDLYVMEMYCRQLLQDTNFRAIMNLKTVNEFFIDHGRAVKSALSINISPEYLLPTKEIYCYLPGTDYILGADNFATTSFYYTSLRKYPDMLFARWLNYMSYSAYYYKFLSMDDIMFGSLDQNFIYIIDLSDLYFTKVNAAVCFIIPASKLLADFELPKGKTPYMLIVNNEEGNEILSLGEGSESVLRSKLPKHDGGESRIKTESGRVSFGRYTSPNGYTYYYSFPKYTPSVASVIEYIVFIILSLAFLVIGIIAIFYLSRKNIRPILELGQKLRESSLKNEELLDEVNRQKPLIASSYFQRLLRGQVSSERELSYIANYLGLESSNVIYNVLYCVIYNNEGTEIVKLPDEEKDRIKGIMMQKLNEYFPDFVYSYSPSPRTFALLLSAPEVSGNALIMNVQDKIKHMHDDLLEAENLWLFAGIGINTNSLMHVWEAYKQANDAISYTTKSYIFFPYEIIKKDSNAFYYPNEFSAKLMNFIAAGNKTQVSELFNLIHRENIVERQLPVNLLTFLLEDIRNTLLKSRFQLPPGLDAEEISEIDAKFNRQLSFSLCEEIALSLSDLYISNNKEDDLITTIERYITENYKDPSLCLNKISDEFKISESYFSHLFKEKTGTNFSLYLENLRMNEAARLVTQTDVNLSELYIATGYNNPVSFRRVFKKVHGVTPSTLRETSK